TPPPQKAATPSDYSQRVVAYIFGNVPITREDLGEYLIARQGYEKIDLLVNKRIIEHAASQRGITVTAAEIEAMFQDHLQGIHVNRKDFVDNVLKQYNKTLYEWKEDVLKIEVLMRKMCKDDVKVSDDDVQQAFVAEFGPKVDVQIIIW